MCSYCDDAITSEEGLAFAKAVNEYITNKENPGMTATIATPKTYAPTATREYVTVQKTVDAQETVYNLKVSSIQAGYLRDVLISHISGEIATFLRPLSTALGVAGAAREYATNNNKKVSVYDPGYQKSTAVVDFADDYDRELAGVPVKSKTKF